MYNNMTKVLDLRPDVTVTYHVGGEFDLEYTEYLEEMEYYKKEQEIADQLWNYLMTLSPDDPEYSDIYKEVHGVRPGRW